jgi:hypothetical protein
MRDNMWTYLGLLIQAEVSVLDTTAWGLGSMHFAAREETCKYLKVLYLAGPNTNQLPSTVLSDLTKGWG